MRTIIATLLGIVMSLTISAQVNVWNLPEKDAPYRSEAYRVSVRTEGDTAWQTVPVLRCDVDLKKVQQAAFAEFDMKGTVYVRIQKPTPDEGREEAVVVRPTARGIEPRRIDGQTIELRLSRPEYLSIEWDGDHTHNLHLFANPMLEETHSADEPHAINWTGQNAQDVFVQDARLIYFGPGVHKPKDLPSEEIKIPSNCTVYLAPGAVVKARLIVDRAENVRIIGRGILDHPLRGIEITYSRNVLIDGPTVLNPAHYTVYGGQSEDITIRHLKTFSCRSWSDGIDLMCCKRVRIEDCFLRTGDDCIALYNHRWWYWGGANDIKVTRCSLWPDVAHPVNIGTHGDDRSDTGEVLSNVCIEDCDVLYARTDAVLKVASGDKNWIRDVKFRDIRVERVDATALFGLAVVFSGKYNRAPGNNVTGVEFSNIHFTGDASQLKPSFIKDYDADHRVDNVSFRHVIINGTEVDMNKTIIKN